jgi:hypothetical protein
MQLDVWATSFAQCDDLLARLDDAMNAGIGATLSGVVNADPFRDGTLVALDPASGFDGFADFVFDGEEDDQTPAQSGRDEWRATLRGECAVNRTITKTLPRLAAMTLRLKTRVTTDPGETDVFAFNSDGTVTHTVSVP